MASFKSYGAVINVADTYTAGHVLTENEATALNGLRTELISHRVRAAAFADLSKGDTASAEQTAAAQAKADEIAASFEFGAARGTGEPRVVDPVEKEARDIARQEMRAAIAKAGLKLGKAAKGDEPEESGEGIYPFSRYAEKVAALMTHENVVAKAKTIVKARMSDKAGAVAVEI